MGSIPHHTSVGSDRQAGMIPGVSSSGREHYPMTGRNGAIGFAGMPSRNGELGTG